jgi:hypothetical protein
MSNGPTVCLLAADVSGDRLAANLAHALHERVPDLRLLGAGGPAMAAAGIEVGVQLTQLSFTGVLDAVQVSRELYRSFRAVQRMVLQARPDLVVLVDAEVVSLPFATWLRRRACRSWCRSCAGCCRRSATKPSSIVVPAPIRSGPAIRSRTWCRCAMSRARR